MVAYALLACFFLFLPQLLKLNRKQINTFAKVSGYFILIEKFIELVDRHIHFHEPIIQLLPFNMCNYTMILAAFMMICRSKRTFALVYFWSVGAILAIATPDIRVAFPAYTSISFFITHYYIYFSVFFCMKYFGFRITFQDFKKAVIGITIIIILIFPLNLLLGTNFMFLKHKPISSPMDYLGPWPFYIISLEIIMLILFTLLYLPFKFRNKKIIEKKLAKQELEEQESKK